MMQLDDENEPQQLILKLEEQLRKLPVEIYRIAGANKKIVGLYIFLSKTVRLAAAGTNLKIAPCAVSSEERSHLFRLLHD